MRTPDGLTPEFTRFVKEVEPRLSYAFFAAYGPEVGSEVTAEALAYAWEHWSRISAMDNPAGYRHGSAQSRQMDSRRCSRSTT